MRYRESGEDSWKFCTVCFKEGMEKKLDLLLRIDLKGQRGLSISI